MRALVGKEHEHVGLVVLGAGLIIVVLSSKEEGTLKVHVIRCGLFCKLASRLDLATQTQLIVQVIQLISHMAEHVRERMVAVYS